MGPARWLAGLDEGATAFGLFTFLHFSMAGQAFAFGFGSNVKNVYSGEVKRLLEQTRPQLATTHRLEFKGCFGAVAGYVDGHIFISCGKFGVALRLPPKILGDLLEEKGVRPLKYFRRGHVKKSYAVLPQRILKDRSRLRALLDESVEHALSSP